MALATDFNEIVDEQASDWSDISFELELPDESRHDEARLLMTPTQLERIAGTRTTFAFSISNTHGYGCHAPLAAQCLDKLDERMIPGRLTVKRILHRVERNWTQGPVMR